MKPQVSFRLDDDTRSLLTFLSKELGISQTDVLKIALRLLAKNPMVARPENPEKSERNA